MTVPFYDPHLSYDDNYDQGPFGSFATAEVWHLKKPAKFTFLGIPIDTPFGIPAGPLLNSQFALAALDHGFSVVVYKTVRSREYPSHPHPNVLAVKVEGNLTLEKAQQPLVADAEYRQPLSITNSFGVPSKSPEVWQTDLRRLVDHARPGQLVVGSFQGTPGKGGAEEFLADWVQTAEMVVSTGVKVLELNLSCPNEGTSNLLCFDLDRVAAIVDAIHERIKLPLVIKIAYFADQDQLRGLVTKVGSKIAAISAINTIPAKIIDAQGNQALPGKNRAVSGVCGDAIRWAGLEMVERLVQLRHEQQLKFEIVGVGGVMTVEDFQAYRQAGAEVVMSATGAMWNPNLGREVTEALETDHQVLQEKFQ